MKRDKKESKVLACGLDTLVVGFGINEYKDSEAWEVLKTGKVEAQAVSKVFEKGVTGVELNGMPFLLYSRGSKGYEFILVNDDVMIMIAKEAQGGSVYPECYVTFRAEYLWRVGADRASMELEQFLSEFMNIAFDKVSRADLAVDLPLALPSIDVYSEIVSQSRNKVVYSEVAEYGTDRRVTDYRFGSGDLIGRLYDKTFEAIKAGDNYMEPVWEAHGWDGSSAVCRLEAQLRRGKLKEFGVNSYVDLRNFKADIWRYFTHNSLRVCDRGSDSNQSRWKEKDWYKDFQDAGGHFGEPQGIMPIKQSNANAVRLSQQALGCSSSAFAQTMGKLGEEEAKRFLVEDCHLDEEFVNSDEFLVEAKRNVNRYRRFERIKEGAGNGEKD